MRYDRITSIRAFATIRFMGGVLQTEQISSILHVEPTTSYVEGQEYLAGPDQRRQVRRTSLWMLDTEKLIDSPRLADHMMLAERILLGKHLHARPHPQIGRLPELLRHQGVNLDVGLFWFGHAGAVAPAVDEGLARAVHDLGGRIELDFATESDCGDELLIA